MAHPSHPSGVRPLPPSLRDVPVQQLHQPSSSLSELPMHQSDLQVHHDANSSFFQGASHVNASNGNFTQIGGDQYVTYNNTTNERMAENACLDKMPRAMAAGYSSENHKTYLQGTREAVLKEIEVWEVDHETNETVYWLKGVTGCGKSTIAQTFAQRIAATGRLGASFFCSRDYPDRRNLRLIFPTLAYHLAYRYATFKSALVQILLTNPEIENDSLGAQLEKLLVRPLQQTKLAATIVIDALDECEDKEPVSAFLSALARYIDKLPHIKFFITGRPENHIRSCFKIKALRTKELPLHDVESATVYSDIRLYVKTELEEIAGRRSLCISGPWPSESDIDAISEKCSGLFIIASIIIRFIDDPLDTPQELLKVFMDMPDSAIYGSGVDATYNGVFTASFKDLTDKNGSNFFGWLRLVVGSIVLAFEPLSRASLAKILEISPERIWNILSRLHSVLLIPESTSEPMRILHKSFADFITDRHRCVDARYCIDAPAHHVELGAGCLKLMNTTLTKNICRLPRYVMNKDIPDLPARREKYIGAPLAYACSSWAKHLQSSSKACDDTSTVLKMVTSFLENNFLVWLEVLSIEGNFHDAIYALHAVRSWLNNNKSHATQPLDLIDDYERFTLRFFDVMRHSATHVYHSALPWSPTLSLIRKLYQSEMTTEAKVLNAANTAWDACIRIIPVYDRVDEVVFSHQGDFVALRATYGVNVLETLTGVSRAAFGVHASVLSISFSPGDNLLAFGHECGTVTVRGLLTGNLVQTFEGHTGEVLSVAFSPCGTMVVSGADDTTIRIWDISSGRCTCILEGNFWSVRAVCYLPTGNQVISASYDTVKIWDVPKRTCLKILREPNLPVTTVMSSNDSFLVVSSKNDYTTMTVYDSKCCDASNAMSIRGFTQSVRFSIDGDKIMYTVGNSGFVWDLSRNTNVSTIEYEGNWGTFSPDGICIASASGEFVTIWKSTRGGQNHKVLANHPSLELVMGWPNVNLIGSRSHEVKDTLARVWDATTRRCLFKVIGNSEVDSVQFNMIPSFLLGDHEALFESNRVEVDRGGSVALSSDESGLAFPSACSDKLLLEGGKCLAYTSTCPRLPSDRGTSLMVNFWDDVTDILTETCHGRDFNLKLIYQWHISLARFSSSGYDDQSLTFSLSQRTFLPIQRTSPSYHDISAPSQSYCYNGGDDWILDQDHRRVLWLPPDERAFWSRVQGKKVDLVTESRKLYYVVDFSAVPISCES